jgi:hypothetical protein
MMPAHAPPSISSGSSSGQSPEIFIDHWRIGRLSTIVAASSRGCGRRISVDRPGMRCSVIRSSAREWSCSPSRVSVPNSTALRYRSEDSKLDRATMMPLSSVTVTQTGWPAAARRIHPDPVEPWTRSLSASRAIAVGITTTPPVSSAIPTWATVLSSRSR